MATGNIDAAFDSYQKMIDLRPDLAAYSRSAHLLFVVGDVENAVWLMKKAVAAGRPVYASRTTGGCDA